ncbi:hypothetical protein [Thioalkalivibrio sp. HK1]|uniref:hypothetical protein n=1 Tax=Thioalkalivibrio sp. HK1 TaxID=1469245 RepID=UPI0012DCB19B|nr:hypothetical protein [Thioalkalivibrio sp. HK1]
MKQFMAVGAAVMMLFGFVGAVHADPQEATSQGGIGYQSSVEEESGWIETTPTDNPIFLAQPTGHGGFLPPPQAVGSCEIQCRDAREDDYGKCMSDCQNKNKASVDQDFIDWLDQVAPTPEQANELFGEQLATTICANLISTPNFCMTFSTSSADGAVEEQPATMLAQLPEKGEDSIETCKAVCAEDDHNCLSWCEMEEGSASVEPTTLIAQLPEKGEDSIETCKAVCAEDDHNCLSWCEMEEGSASVEPTTLIASLNSCEHCAKEDGHAQQDCYDTCKAAQQSSAAEQPTMMARINCDKNGVCTSPGQPKRAGAEQPTMLASDGSYEQCKDHCNSLDWYLQKACFDNCDQNYGNQASLEEKTMIADIRIGDPKPICGTDAWACFNGTDDESPAIRDVGIFGVFASNHGCFHPSCD